MKTLTWVQDDRQYMCGSRLYLGKWEVGGAHYDGCVSKDDPEKYISTCILPGIKKSLGRYTNEEDAKARTERAVNIWLEEIK